MVRVSDYDDELMTITDIKQIDNIFPCMCTVIDHR